MSDLLEFTIYSNGICFCSVCSSLSPEETEMRINRENPSGTLGGWLLTEDDFMDGDPNPVPCNENPETHKHYLFAC